MKRTLSNKSLVRYAHHRPHRSAWGLHLRLLVADLRNLYSLTVLWARSSWSSVHALRLISVGLALWGLSSSARLPAIPTPAVELGEEVEHG